MSGICRLLLTAYIIKCIHGYLLDDLVHHLLDDYESAVRPSCDTVEATNIDIDLALRQIIDLDEPKQILNTIIWIRLRWYDCRLRWFETKYKNIKSIVLPQNRIWIPDITLYDNAANKLSGIDEYHLTIDNNGTVSYNFPSVIKSLCAVDVTHFPFDYQACRLEFGSWAHSGSQLNVWNMTRMADLTSYIENVEWYIKSVPLIRNETFYGEEMYPTIRLYILLELKALSGDSRGSIDNIQRRPMFHVLNLLFPCLLITSIAMLGFLLPPVSGEKVNLEITVLLSLAVFQLIVLELMPPTGDSVPFIGLYFTISMILVSLSCLATVTVLNIHFKSNGESTIPRWLKVGFYIPLTKIMCLTDVRTKWKRSTASIKYRNKEHGVINHSNDRGTPYLTSYNRPTENGHYDSSEVRESGRLNDNYNIDEIESNTISDMDPASTSHIGEYKNMPNLIEDIERTLGDIDVHVMEGKHNNMESSEWRLFSMMLDRLFMAMYFISLVAIAIGLISRYIQMRHLPKIFTDLNIQDDLMIQGFK